MQLEIANAHKNARYNAPRPPSRPVSPVVLLFPQPSASYWLVLLDVFGTYTLLRKMNGFDYGPPNGFTLRRNTTCSANEHNCTYNPWGENEWHNCCPQGSYCVDGDNYICCPTESGCRINLTQDPHCANNETWNLWINYLNEDKDGDYFCCPPGQVAFVQSLGVDNNGVGCADPPLTRADQKTLSLVASGKSLTRHLEQGSICAYIQVIRIRELTVRPLGYLGTPSASRTPSATATPTDAPAETSAETNKDASPSTGSSNKGAIAGGVVGGCAGLALIIALVWFLLHRRRKQTNATISPDASTPAEKYTSAPRELPGSPTRSELPSPGGILHELPANER